MTIWNDVTSFVRLRYEVLEDHDGWLRFRLPTEDGRTQQATVHLLPDHSGVAWAELSSPVGWADRVDLRRLLELVGAEGVGGAAIVDGVALIKHTVPLASLDIAEELDQPLRTLVARADELERELGQGDEF
ncbi:hypothetical protein [Amycolatopsis sp. FDAARGOS 1241]|uniref:hypothetical protein n=1 Tax=Amycolatopsis sp. FDAARGOS 1241 TaxID=2778070 RepID=UPI00194F4C07|nr:hypothetical protein [Amycolatopsis sp. FDAARGOS 1241]QRP43690.1 hypothetical protein I6J71_30540 [Amycolatopsis sp. FDAARGOS 1241]